MSLCVYICIMGELVDVFNYIIKFTFLSYVSDNFAHSNLHIQSALGIHCS